jgi:hypothetical protein
MLCKHGGFLLRTALLYIFMVKSRFSSCFLHMEPFVSYQGILFRLLSSSQICSSICAACLAMYWKVLKKL